MNQKQINIFLTLVTLISFLIRIYQTALNPPLLWDEASLGYNAYSILKTGKDEYGRFLPLIFKSFGDYKPGLYVYLCLPFVALFGLSPLTARLPSIILGSLCPLLLFLLIKRINPKNNFLAFTSALLLALTPYNIHFSRGAWETNILTFELLLCSLLFFKQKYFLSSIIFGLSLYTYQAGKLISLLLLLSLLITCYKQIKLRYFVKSFIFPLFLFTIPVAYGLLFSNSGNRLQVVSLFSYPRSQAETETILSESGSLDYNAFHNRLIFFQRNFLGRYFNHFSSKFLIFEGDWQNSRHGAPYTGVLLFPSLIFLAIGFLTSTYSFKSPSSLFFLLWLIISPIPAALTRDSLQAVRSMSFSIPLTFFTAAGIHSFYLFIKRFIPRYFVIGGITIAYLLSFVYYSDLYLNHLTKINPQQWLMGYRPSIEYLIEKQNNYQHIYFTDYFGQPYIYYLFYSRYSPSAYQSQASLISSGLDTGKVESVGPVIFSSPPFEAIKDQPSTLAFYSQEEIIRQGINNSPYFSKFTAIDPQNNHSNFYVFENR